MDICDLYLDALTIGTYVQLINTIHLKMRIRYCLPPFIFVSLSPLHHRLILDNPRSLHLFGDLSEGEKVLALHKTFHHYDGEVRTVHLTVWSVLAVDQLTPYCKKT